MVALQSAMARTTPCAPPACHAVASFQTPSWLVALSSFCKAPGSPLHDRHRRRGHHHPDSPDRHCRRCARRCFRRGPVSARSAVSHPPVQLWATLSVMLFMKPPPGRITTSTVTPLIHPLSDTAASILSNASHLHAGLLCSASSQPSAGHGPGNRHGRHRPNVLPFAVVTAEKGRLPPPGSSLDTAAYRTARGYRVGSALLLPRNGEGSIRSQTQAAINTCAMQREVPAAASGVSDAALQAAARRAASSCTTEDSCIQGAGGS
jgi:hypothetical protein